MPLVGALPDGARLVAVLGGLPATDRVPLIGAESQVVPFQTVGDNVLLGAEGASGFFPRRRDLDRRAAELLGLVGLDVPPATPILDLSVVDQRIVELGRALARTPDLVVIDDRSAALSAEEAERWYAAVARASDVVPVVVAVNGLADLAPTGRPIDSVLVLRDGAIAGAASATEADELLELLVGDEVTPVRPARVLGPVVLELRDFSVTHPIHRNRLRVDRASLRVRSGEIVGLAGAQDLVLGMFGASSGGQVSGEVLVDGVPADLSSVDRAIASRVLYISEHPPTYDVGIIGGIPTSVSGESLARLARLGIIDPRREYSPRRAPSLLLEAIPGARVRPSTSDMNDVLAGWATSPPRVALITEPFSGLDPAERAERGDLIEAIAAAGSGVVLEAAEPNQLLGLSDRLLIQRGPRLAIELAGEEATARGVAALSIRTDIQR